MLHRLRSLGLSVQVFETGSGVGGTWFWNRYPGAHCDVESMEYSYQFSKELEQEWVWTERFASQAEILRYLDHVVDRFDLRPYIRLETRVTSAVFDEAANRWLIATDRGDRLSAKFCIMATGCLSSTNTPKFEGIESFAGRTFHTGRWPHERVDFSGARVGIIGTGSSAIQAIPVIAREASHLYVFQRTPAYSVPAGNHLLDPETERQTKKNYTSLRRRGSEMPFGWDASVNEKSALQVSDEERRREYEARWERGGLWFYGAFVDLLYSAEANETAKNFFRNKIREIVRDPAVADLLTPQQTFGCKRLCQDTGYYETFNRSNVNSRRRSQIADRRDHAARFANEGCGVSSRLDRVRYRFRCHDRDAAESRHSR